MAKKGPPLSGDDAALWAAVARSATPLRARPVFAAEPAVLPTSPKRQSNDAAAPPAARHATAPGAIDRRTTRRIARGAIAIDARIDLHGHTQAEAHRRLLDFLLSVQDNGGRLVLVITGKGAVGEGGGVLRRMLPGWLSSPRFRPLVLGFDEAHRSHGGGGAFYVRLKRLRD
jgi:DNA-nicking Smr family endonuclease